MATQGVMPTSVPNQNGFIVVDVRPGGFIVSCNQPNRIMPTLAPITVITELMLVTPE